MRKDIMLNNLGFLDVNPLTLGMQECAAGHSWGPSLRSYYLIHYVFSGKGTFTTTRGSYSIGRGEVFVMRPDEICSYKADEHDSWRYCWVGFECVRPIDDILANDHYNAIDCESLFYSLRDADKVQSREWFVCGRIYEILSRLNVQSDVKANESNRYIKMARNYIESQYTEQITIEGLARQLGLNRSYFSKIFRQETGKSPQDYLVDFRLEKAALLLRGGGTSCGEIARMVGYADELNFSRMFRRRYGISPGKYRKTK